IPQDHFVISFRAIENGAKGTEYIRKMLEMLKPSKPITILTVNEIGSFDGFKNKYNIIEVGWVHDDAKMVEIYGATDLFLMPSVAESFGLMAIEAMACGKPVVIFDGTALPGITFAPSCGVLVNKYDSRGLKEAVERMMINEEDRLHRGKTGRELAQKYYDVNHYFDQTLALYQDILSGKFKNKLFFLQ
ncbi:MAG: glycosyltransferase, partial [Clostridia bacterium]|nr:glycosyltransferase [Clostridia bacterium]